VTYKKGFAMLHESAINVFEDFIGTKLPLDYKNYLISLNGGRPEKATFDIPNQGNSAVNRFFSLVSKVKSETLIFNIKIYKDRVPEEMLPIGNDPGGNLIVLSLKGRQRGGVFFWDHDLEADDEQQPFYKNITILSQDFSSFLSALY
jgi:SMI1-KNR4 cell-wall